MGRKNVDFCRRRVSFDVEPLLPFSNLVPSAFRPVTHVPPPSFLPTFLSTTHLTDRATQGEEQEAERGSFEAMSGAGPPASGGAASVGDGINANANGEPLDRLASDGSKYFRSQQQKESLEEAYTSALGLKIERGTTARAREREREREEESLDGAAADRGARGPELQQRLPRDGVVGP